MTAKLSNAFFGDKKLTQTLFQSIKNQSNGSFKLNSDLVYELFKPYTQKLISIKSISGDNLSLFDLFTQFILQVGQRFSKWQFQKLSSILQISAHVFQHSFEHWLSRQDSFKYFSEVVVRHSLFRPPHSVCIFSYDQMKEITDFWIENFDKYYEEYEQCFKSNLSQTLNCTVFPQKIDKQKKLKEGKIVIKQQISKFLSF